jgi:beta-glucosidase
MTSSITKRLESLLSQMTLEEKLAQIGSCWVYEMQTRGELDQEKIAGRLKDGIGQITRVAGASTFDPVSAAKANNRLQKFLLEQTRLRIPAIIHEECCSGAMMNGGTGFPQILGLAATFQPELAKMMTTTIRRQLCAIGARQGLAPVLDLALDARWGRVEETFGEDPTLASHFGVAYVKGLQGDDLTEGVLATGKHFVGHGLSQGGLNCGPVHVGMRDIYNLHLAPFQAAIRDAGLASIMNAYPELDGEVVATSRRILTDLLRDELGFDGLVVSDYEAVIMIHNYHYVAADKSTAACLALEAGIDVELPTVECYGEALKEALEAGDISLETIDLAVRRHLQKKFELGLFDDPYVDDGRVLEVFEAPGNRLLAQEIAGKSMVLLKNDGLLPLDKSPGTLAVIGPNANDGRNLLGDYSYIPMMELMLFQAPDGSNFVHGDAAATAGFDTQITTVLEGIQAVVSPDTKVLYAKGCDVMSGDTSGFDEAVSVAQQADKVILVLGDRSGLTPLCSTGETRDSADLLLPGVQGELAQAIIATGKPVVVVLVNGRPIAMPWLAEHANAILEAWLPGEVGGKAVADVLFGEVNPGGKLPITFPRSVGQLPITYNYKPSGMRSHWYVNYVAEEVTPLYPFGHGLSYASFEYTDLEVAQEQVTAGETVDVSFKITNTGSVAGDEVPQLYIRDLYASMPRPVKELKGYVRLTLQPGESKTIIFHLPVDQLAFYDQNLDLMLEPGDIKVMIGSSSEDIHLFSSFKVTGEGKLPVKERVFVCPVEIL